MDPLWTNGPIHIRVSIYGPIMDPVIQVSRIYGPIKDAAIFVYSHIDPLWTNEEPIMDRFISVYLYTDPLWTIHIRVFIYGPIMDPSWTYSCTCVQIYGPSMEPVWTNSYTCIHIWTHYGPTMNHSYKSLPIYVPIMNTFIYVYS